MHTIGQAIAAFLTSLSAFLPLPVREVSYVAPAPETPRATVLFGGDMMFDRSIRLAIEEHVKERGDLPADLPVEASAQAGDFIFLCIDDVLRGADLVVANLEGPITQESSVSVRSKSGGEFNYTFTFSTSTAPLLARHNIRVVDLGNNHILNFGAAGLESTRAALRAARVSYFGSPAIAGAAAGDPFEDSVSEQLARGVRIAFVSYNEFAPPPASGGAPGTVAQIERERLRGFLPVVYAHWGVEYATTSSAYMRELAHRFVGAGAEMVIGSHPHVVQEHEVYKGKYIYYSLGNFIFDQYFSEDVRRGLLLEVVFTPRKVESVGEIPIFLERDGRTCSSLLKPAVSLEQNPNFLPN